MTPQHSISDSPSLTSESRLPFSGMASLAAVSAALLYAVAALVIGAGDIGFILRHYTRYAFGDHWIWLAHYAEGGLPRALLSQYNEHRLLFPGILYWIDLRFFGGKNGFLIAASVAINLSCIVLLAMPFLRRLEIPWTVRTTFLGFVTILMLWYIQGPNFFYPFSLCLALANLGILSSLYLFTTFYESASAGPRRQDLLLAASLGCGFIATFSYGHGILIWPLLLCDALILRLRLRQWIPIAVAAVVALGLYFRNYVTPPSHSSPLAGLRSPLRLAEYFFIMMGLPWLGGGNADLSWRLNLFRYAIIFGGLAAGAFLIYLFVFRRAATGFDLFYSSLLLLAIGSVTITALGRTTFPLGQSLSGRYAPIPLLFWISLIALLTFYLCRFEARGGAGRFLWCAVLAAISIATLPTQFVVGDYLAGREKAQELAVDSIAVGVPDPAITGVELYSSFPLIQFSDQHIMRSLQHRSLFQLPESGLLGTALQPRFQIAEKCQGTVDDARLYQGDGKSGVRFAGWLFDARLGGAAEQVLVTDPAGAILGFGLGGYTRPDVAATLHNPAMRSAGWIAYSRLPADGSRQFRIFGEFAGSSSICEVISPKTALPETAPPQ